MQNLTNSNLPGLIAQAKDLAPRGVVDIERCLNEGTEVAAWNRNHGKKNTIKLFVIYIADLCNSFNVNRPMNPAQIEDLATDFATELWFIKLEEIPAFFQGVKKGVYGKIYERLDAPTIWGCWDVYALDRAEVIESRQAAKMFRDPGTTKNGDDVRSGKIDKLGFSIGQMKDHFKKDTTAQDLTNMGNKYGQK